MAASESSWVEDIADEVVAFVAKRGKPTDEPILVASGISPSGPIHLGNLREIMVAHAVGEELAHRGRPVRHLHFWDDYDRFRRVPSSVAPSFEQYLGRPLSAVPDPEGTCHPSYAEHFIAELDDALTKLAIRTEQIRQSVAYQQGIYSNGVVMALEGRDVIAKVLARHRTKDAPELDAGGEDDQALPFRIFCESCGRDFTEFGVSDELGIATYHCDACGHDARVALGGPLSGKLVWKVDWPMRWAHYGIDFEPGGVDHSSPGSSYEVGAELVRRVFHGVAPYYVGYSFVGIEGRSKLSGSHGDVPTPNTALRVLEPRILRWQYVRRRPQASFSVSFGSEVLRLYDEWDSLQTRVANGRASHAESVFWRMSVRTSAGEVDGPATSVPFRILSAAADVTHGNREQLIRVVREQTSGEIPVEKLDSEVEPRLSCAIEWALSFQPEDERTRIRSTPAEVTLTADQRDAVKLLVVGLKDHWTLEGLTELVYGIPKLVAGLPIDAAPDQAMKQSQRAFFSLLYMLLTLSDTGPRIPTLLLSLGHARVEALLSPFAKEKASEL